MSDKCKIAYCKKPHKENRTLCEEHLKFASKRTGTYYKKKKELGICVECGNEPNDGTSLKCAACRIKHNTKSREYQRVRHKEHKDLVYEAYGGYICNCCGEKEPLMLTVDHINNDGNTHRKDITAQGQINNGYSIADTSRSKVRETGRTEQLYTWLIKNNFPDGFQILCWNCNCGKARNNGTCPHKERAKV